jgi:hypothetical protein
MAALFEAKERSALIRQVLVREDPAAEMPPTLEQEGQPG